VIDWILEWQQRSGFRPSLYTWLTINFYKLETLMAKMRRAGFDMLFIGIESFNENSLLKTAKVQNTAPALIEAIRTIQARSFIVVAGFIFGFDFRTTSGRSSTPWTDCSTQRCCRAILRS
jgi:radical SAM superfamily enzyme YgiQ (UPF0313 family)